MIIDNFAKFIMRGRKQAIFMALLFSILPLFGWVGVVIIGLVTLCKGAWEGLLVLLWAALPAVVVAVLGSRMPLISNVLCGSLLVWFLALVLRRYASWALVLETAIIIGVLVVFLAHLFVPDLQAWWHTQLFNAMQTFAKMAHVALKTDQVKPLSLSLSYYATGVQAIFFLFSAFVELLLARVLQSRLYRPGGWKQEWVSLRLSYMMASACMICLLLAAFGPSIFKDIVPLLLFPFLIAGISLGHGLLSHYSGSVIWLFYILIVVATVVFPVVLGIFIIAALTDSFVDFRRFKRV